MPKAPFTQALHRLRQMIDSGKYPLHSRLPAERELVEHVQVSRVTLRRALGVLEAEGRIWRHVGYGTFVGATPPVRDVPTLITARPATPQQLLEARLVVEPAIAARAAMTATPDDLKYMRQCLRKRESAADTAMYELWDHSLHRAIADATRNPLLAAMLEALNSLRLQPEWKAYRVKTFRPDRRAESAVQHRQIVASIEKRDPQAAFDAMHRHISTIQTNIVQQSVD